MDKDSSGRQSLLLTEQGDCKFDLMKQLKALLFFHTNVTHVKYVTEGPKPPRSNSIGGMLSHVDNRKTAEGSTKKRRISSAKQELDTSSMSDDETFSATPCLVNLGPGVRISTVAAGGRHTLVLSGNSPIPCVMQPTSVFRSSNFFLLCGYSV